MNRLKDSTSPYLLQHADNPVDWWPWCDEAFEEAARRDVPVLLSVGYAACHWCHVMALATSMTVPVVGALLMFSLMIGPAAAARSLTARPILAMTLSVAIALVTVWVGIALSYRTDWPLGFFVGVIGAAFYLAGRAYRAVREGLSPRPRVA